MTRRLFAPGRPRGRQTLDHSLGTIRIDRKAIRHLYLRLDAGDGSLRVSAPNRVSDQAIRDFVTARGDWIDRQRRRLARRPAVITDDQLPDRLHLLGREHVLVWETDETTPRPRLQQEASVIHIRCGGKNRARVLLRDHCRQRFKAVLDDRVPDWAHRMGLPCPETRIRRMRSRWGSCNINARRIWLNLELVRVPIEAIDLVIVHELAHLIQRGHNARFYGVMDHAYPDWRRWEATLSEYGIIGL